MQKMLSLLSLAILFSCNSNSDSGTLTVHGEIKNFTADKIYVEELHFNGQTPTIIDSASITKNNFSINTKVKEEGLYRLRLAGQPNGFMFINDKNDIFFKVDSTDLSLNGPTFNTPANSSFKKFIGTMDSLSKDLTSSRDILNQLKESGAKETDSNFINAVNNFNDIKNKITKFCFQYGDTTQSPILAIFSTTTAPVEIDKFEIPLDNLTKRFPKHSGVSAVAVFAKQKIAQAKQQTQNSNTKEKIAVGNMAPDITMPDTDGNPFSLSMLRGKYVLVDFWASWCGPCRGENPNVVAAYNEFKDKNFTVLGVSLDEKKEAWLKAIKEDKLDWKHISDLQYWNSAAIELYGFDGIPFNVLVDPEGKVIATDLRGEDLINQLQKVLK
jgi:peroxiredoxin